MEKSWKKIPNPMWHFSCFQDKVPPVENEPSKGVESYTWVKVASDENQPVPSGRSKHAIAVHAGYIYLYGGRDGHIGHKDLWRFEIGKDPLSCFL